MNATKSQAELLDILRSLLRESLRLQSEGATQPRLGQAIGYVDGFVRALLEGGIADHVTLLKVVREVRAERNGAPTTVLANDPAKAAA